MELGFCFGTLERDSELGIGFWDFRAAVRGWDLAGVGILGSCDCGFRIYR